MRTNLKRSDSETRNPVPAESAARPAPALVSAARKAPRVRALRPEYRELVLKPRSFVGSVVLHITVIAALFLLPAIPYHTIQRPVYEELIKPDAHKIVWYNYPKKQLPDVDAPKRIGVFPKPVGTHRAESAIIATSPQPKSQNQIIWQPVPKVEIKQDIPTPNLIARAASAIPAPPPPPEPKPKAEKPQPEGIRAPQPNPSPKQPDADVKKAPDTPAPIEVPKPRKAFVAPPVAKREPKLPVPVQASDIPMPETSIVGSSAVKSALPAGMGTAVIANGPPPPPNAPPGQTNEAGNAKVDIAVASLHPSDKPGPIPDGSRPGQFAQSPLVGELATGDVSGKGLSVPNLTIRDKTKIDPPPVTGNRKVVLYADRIRNVNISTLSVPLRPGSRTIPRSIDARFQGRNVYTMVLPIENIAPYSGDWILWFAEKQIKAGETPFVRAPVPLRKFETVEPMLPGTRSEMRMQFTVVITKEGKLENLGLLRSVNPGLDQVVLQDLATWEFKPATRDGAPVDVDAVIEIPFIVSAQLAKGTQP